MKKGKLYGIGVGPGDSELMTLKAVRVLKNIDILAVPESTAEKGSIAFSIASDFISENTKRMILTFPMSADIKVREKARLENALKIREALENGSDIAFLTLGDPLLYSTFTYLMEHLCSEGIDIEIIPGIAAYSAIASDFKMPLAKDDEKLCIVTEAGGLEAAGNGCFDTIICMKVSSYSLELGKFIKMNNLENNFIMVTSYGLDNQKVCKDVNVLLNNKACYLTTAIIRKGGFCE